MADETGPSPAPAEARQAPVTVDTNQRVEAGSPTLENTAGGNGDKPSTEVSATDKLADEIIAASGDPDAEMRRLMGSTDNGRSELGEPPLNQSEQIAADAANASTEAQSPAAAPSAESTDPNDFSLKAQMARRDEMRNNPNVDALAADDNNLARQVVSERAQPIMTVVEEPQAQTTENGMASTQPLTADALIREADDRLAKGMITPEQAQQAKNDAEAIAARNNPDNATPIPGLEPKAEQPANFPPTAEAASVDQTLPPLEDAKPEDVSAALEAETRKAAEAQQIADTMTPELKAKDSGEIHAEGRTETITPEMRAKQIEDTIEITSALKDMGVDFKSEQGRALTELMKQNPDALGEVMEQVNEAKNLATEMAKLAEEKGLPVNAKDLNALTLNAVLEKTRQEAGISEQEAAGAQEAEGRQTTGTPGQESGEKPSEAKTAAAKKEEETKERKRLIWRILLAIIKALGTVAAEALMTTGAGLTGAGESLLAQTKGSSK